MKKTSAPPSAIACTGVANVLLGWLDACLTDRTTADPEGRKRALDSIKQCIAAVVPVDEADFFALAARLRDKNLTRALRDAIAGNLARAASLMISRQQRRFSQMVTYSSEVEELRRANKEALELLLKALQCLRSWRSSLDQAGGSNLALEASLFDIEAADMRLFFANACFEDRLQHLNELEEARSAETALFAESVVATAH